MMLQGRVKVNGKVVRELGTRVDPQSDSVMVDGRPIQLDPDRIYLAFHKPKGIVSTMEDEYGRPCLADFFVQYDRVFNVGRLDQCICSSSYPAQLRYSSFDRRPGNSAACHR